MEYTECPICQADRTDFFYDKERDNNSVNFVICTQCGLVYQNPRLTQEAFSIYYQESFRDQEIDDDKLDEYINSRINVGTEIYSICTEFLYKGKLNRLKNFINGNKSFSVLDIGCGVGGILKPFKDAGFKCKGIDTPSYYTKVGKERLGIDIEEVFLDEYYVEERYDIIILNHSLEHFLDPLKDLERVRGLLKRNGIIYIEVPNIKRPYNWKPLPFFFMLGHVFYYSPKTLELLLNKCGFERIYLNDIDTPFMKNIFVLKNNRSYKIDEAEYSEIIKLYKDFNN